MVLLYFEYENTYREWKEGASKSLKAATGVGRGQSVA